MRTTLQIVDSLTFGGERGQESLGKGDLQARVGMYERVVFRLHSLDPSLHSDKVCHFSSPSYR